MRLGGRLLLLRLFLLPRILLSRHLGQRMEARRLAHRTRVALAHPLQDALRVERVQARERRHAIASGHAIDADRAVFTQIGFQVNGPFVQTAIRCWLAAAVVFAAAILFSLALTLLLRELSFSGSLSIGVHRLATANRSLSCRR